jgi:prevent-host-death family protein
MGQIWQLQEAKSRLSELVNQAIRDGPQIITRHGDEVAVVISYDEYSRLRKPEISLVEFFRASPLVGIDLDLGRDRSPLRPDVDL